jgi:hypothetical protein
MTYCKVTVDALGRLVKEERGSLLVMPLRARRPPRARRVKCRVLRFDVRTK